MMAVAKDYQNKGVGGRLKWAQRERALSEGRKLIKWTWDPMQARNAHFNLNRLGALVEAYAENFYGIDYSVEASLKDRIGLPSDRLFATWHLAAERVRALATGATAAFAGKQVGAVAIPSQWQALVKSDPQRALDEQARVRGEFKQAFENGLICGAFERGEEQSKYLLFEQEDFGF
jgi:predicted GNAT superfamily acetyltransferase